MLGGAAGGSGGQSDSTSLPTLQSAEQTLTFGSYHSTPGQSGGNNILIMAVLAVAVVLALRERR